MTVCCEQLQKHAEDQEVAIVNNRRFREYGIRVLDGGTSVIRIKHCPWCGRELPESLRMAWFSRLEKLGLEVGDPDMPEEMKSDAWWK